MGGLVVHVPMDTVGEEVEFRLVGTAWGGDHAAVRERFGAGGAVAAALFGPLRAGAYQFRWRTGAPGPEPVFEVSAGTVGEVVLDRH